MDKRSELALELLKNRINAYWNSSDSTNGNKWLIHPNQQRTEEWTKDSINMAKWILQTIEKFKPPIIDLED